MGQIKNIKLHIVTDIKVNQYTPPLTTNPRNNSVIMMQAPQQGRGPMQPQIILLKEGTDTSQGIPQLISNINACEVVADAIRTTLGPRGMDKLIVVGNQKATISNDGATIMKLLEIVHPAAKTLVDIAKSQDAEVGDGTTSVVLLASEFLAQLRPYIEEGVHPQVVIRAMRKGTKMAVDKIKEIAVQVKRDDPAE